MDLDDLKRIKIETYLKWGLGAAAALIISPVVFLILKGAAGLLACAILGTAGVNLMPWFAMKMANWKVKAIVDESNRNPIETMENLRIEKQEELDQADRNIVDFETEIGNFDDKMVGFKKQYPEEAPRYEELSAKMHELLEEMKKEQTEAQEKLRDFIARIAKAKAIFDMSGAANKLAAMSKSAQAKVFADIKEQVAFDRVRTELNRSFASLNMAISKRTERVSLELPAATAVPARRLT